MMKKKICLFTAFLMAFSVFSGCGKNSADVETVPELFEPVGIVQDYAKVERQDLIKYKTYAAKVVPEIVESSFATNQNFLKYGSLPGDTVKKNDVLVYASTENLDKQIDALKEQMDKDLESYNEYVKEANEKIEKTKADLEYDKRVVSNFENMTEEDKDAYGRDIIAWQYPQYKSLYTKAVATLQRSEQELKKRTELYELDSSYNAKYLNTLISKKKDVLATAGMDGVVVSIHEWDNGAYISKDMPVAAVGNFDELRLVTETIYKSEIKKAVELYTVVNGKKYDTTFIDTTASTSNNGEVLAKYTTFVIDDPNGEVKSGDFAEVVIVSAKKEGALCVPSSAIKKDSESTYVYVKEGEKNSLVEVTTGMKSGFYTEVLNGVSEGDLIVSDFKVAEKSKTGKVSYGSVSSEFKGTGYIFYSQEDYVTNPVKYGTAYLDEVCVSNYQRVKKGDVIAKIHVKGDTIGIERNERTLLRAKEDLAELVENNEDDKNAKAITAKQEYINDLEEKINEMKADSNRKEIVAPVDGIITLANMWFEPGDIMDSNGAVAVIAAEKDCFVEVEDKNGVLTYGNEVKIKYNDQGKETYAKGEVVTVSSMVLSEDLANSGKALIKVAPEDLSKMAASNRGMDGWWNRSSFSVTATIRSVDNVLVVPKRSVTVEDNVPYVTVLDDKGNFVYKSFIAGGSDNEYYWVVDGLTEGTEICLE